MKSKHDLGCGARQNERCDCRQGRDRRIKRRADKRFKRQRKHIAERTGLHYDETLIETCLRLVLPTKGVKGEKP